MHDVSFVVLAAGLGRRMKSKRSKVLHEIGGKPMVQRTVETVKKLRPNQVIIVANKNNLKNLQKILGAKVTYVIQPSQMGTADAARAALPVVKSQNVAVLYGDDTAFYGPEILERILSKHVKSEAIITFVTLVKADPGGLGRVLRKNRQLAGIVEEKDATFSQKRINEVNDGVYFFQKSWLVKNIRRVKNSPVTGEYYLTDLVNLAIKDKQKVETHVLSDQNHWHSINTPEELEEAKVKLEKRTHVMGIAGAGASAIAAIAKQQGFNISGCDINPHSAYESNLKDIDIKQGHQPSHLHNIGKLVISSAILKNDPKNKEVTYAKKHKIPILLWEKFQSEYLQNGKFTVAVAGAYGKSTTTAMISKVLTDAGLDPTCEIGAKVLEWGVNYRVGKSKYYVCEVDEYLDKFLNYNPDVAVVLNLGWDHPDYFKTKRQVEKSYKKFVQRIKPRGFLVLSSEIKHLSKSAPKSVKTVVIEDFGKYNLSIIGDFRRENANAALTVAKLLNLDIKKAKRVIENFKGTGRRLEFKGEIDGVKIYDDYAVQPYTVLKTTNALKTKHPNSQLTLIFEPHTFSRINTFFNQFVDALKRVQADKILITNVYRAREQGDVKKLAKKLASVIGPKAVYSGSIEKTSTIVKNQLSNYDVILSMGAGDVYKIYDKIKNG